MNKWLTTGLLAMAAATTLAACTNGASVAGAVASTERSSGVSDDASNDRSSGAISQPGTQPITQPGDDRSLDGSRGGGGGNREGEIRIALTPSAEYAGIKAKAKYKNRGGERELEVEAERLRTGTVVSVCVNGSKAGGATANALGEARLNLNSDAGQTVPNVVAGTSVQVRAGTSCDGALIASGKF